MPRRAITPTNAPALARRPRRGRALRSDGYMPGKNRNSKEAVVSRQQPRGPSQRSSALPQQGFGSVRNMQEPGAVIRARPNRSYPDLISQN